MERHKQSDTLCQMCKRSGTLVQCDRCPRAYHKECVGLSSIPESWFCPFCKKMYKGEKPLARQVQMVKTSSTKLSSCVLCRSTDFLKSGFGPRTVILCDQCDKEYHIGCLKGNNMCDLKELPSGDWFCSNDCKKINSALKELDLCEPEPLPDLVSHLIKKKCEEKGLHMNADTDLRWKLIHGTASAAKNPILSRIVSILHESFKPIKDDATGRDLIKAMVYGRKIGSRDFNGMHCAVLTVNSFVVSVAIFRVLGCQVAEMPLVATCTQDQGMGYFQSLFWCILRTLSHLGVKHFLVPAANDAVSYWRNKFGFEKISRDQLPECTKDLYLMVFEGTSLLHKQIPAPQVFSEGSRRS
uniref:Increased DNA methylation 1 n=1 Tax=Elaeis guineensis var. tenera TaxID=51953 RepID=A0A8N4F4I3_ELAGV|nr:increased DNA methylation 1 [Elaeis guineensis]